MSMNQAVDQLASRVKLLEQDIDRIVELLEMADIIQERQ